MKEIKHQVITVGTPDIHSLSKEALISFCRTLLHKIVVWHNEAEKSEAEKGSL